MDSHYVLHRLIPYRLQAVASFNHVLRLNSAWDGARPMQLLIDGKLVIEGNSNAFTNPVIETGLIHCRALLEFLGLSMSKAGTLQSLQRTRSKGDVGIEQFSNAGGPLPLVSPALAISHCPGGAAEVEQALISVFHTANKGLAHLTSSFIEAVEQAKLLEIASRRVPALIVSHLYTPLGLQAPEYQLKSRPREDS